MRLRCSPMLQSQHFFFGINDKPVPSNVLLDDTKNKYQESRMLFFASHKKPAQKAFNSRPKTIQDIKKLQSFVRAKKDGEGSESLSHSIKSMAKRDESFNEFLRNFKAKNEQNWSNIIDMTQEE